LVVVSSQWTVEASGKRVEAGIAAIQDRGFYGDRVVWPSSLSFSATAHASIAVPVQLKV
jgi:hypothetical protein